MKDDAVNLETMRKELLEKDSEHGERMLRMNTVVALEKIMLANIEECKHAIEKLGHLSDTAPLLNALRLLERHAQRLDVLDKLATTFGAAQPHSPARQESDSDIGWNRNGRQLAAAS